MFTEISDKKWNLKLFPDFYQSNSREPLIAQISELLNWKFSFFNPSMVSSGAVPRRCHISCILKCSLKSSFHILSLIEIWLFRNNSLFPVGLSNRRFFFLFHASCTLGGVGVLFLLCSFQAISLPSLGHVIRLDSTLTHSDMYWSLGHSLSFIGDFHPGPQSSCPLTQDCILDDCSVHMCGLSKSLPLSVPWHLIS